MKSFLCHFIRLWIINIKSAISQSKNLKNIILNFLNFSGNSTLITINRIYDMTTKSRVVLFVVRTHENVFLLLSQSATRSSCSCSWRCSFSQGRTDWILWHFDIQLWDCANQCVYCHYLSCCMFFLKSICEDRSKLQIECESILWWRVRILARRNIQRLFVVKAASELVVCVVTLTVVVTMTIFSFMLKPNI